MNHDSPEYQKMLAELKHEYIKGLGAKLEHIEMALETKDVALLREHFHKFKGNGKTYGYPEISVVMGSGFIGQETMERLQASGLKYFLDILKCYASLSRVLLSC